MLDGGGFSGERRHGADVFTRGTKDDSQTKHIPGYGGKNPAHAKAKERKMCLEKINIACGERERCKAMGQPCSKGFADIESIYAIGCEVFVRRDYIGRVADGVKKVGNAHKHGEKHGCAVDTLTVLKQGGGNSRGNKGDGKGVQEHEHGNGQFDDVG